MMSVRAGVAHLIKKASGGAMMAHCYGHSLQLGVAEAVRAVPVIRYSENHRMKLGRCPITEVFYSLFTAIPFMLRLPIQ